MDRKNKCMTTEYLHKDNLSAHTISLSKHIHKIPNLTTLNLKAHGLRLHAVIAYEHLKNPLNIIPPDTWGNKFEKHDIYIFKHPGKIPNLNTLILSDNYLKTHATHLNEGPRRLT